MDQLRELAADLRKKGSGASLVFLHGHMGRTWDAFLDGLAESHTVDAPLHPGCEDEVDLMWLGALPDLLLWLGEQPVAHIEGIACRGACTRTAAGTDRWVGRAGVVRDAGRSGCGRADHGHADVHTRRRVAFHPADPGS